MNHKDYLKLIQFARIEDQLIATDRHEDFINELVEGEICYMKPISYRNIKFHRAYFAFTGFIYDSLPRYFQANIKKKNFYRYIQTKKGDYEVIKFPDCQDLIEYKSISFGKMSEFEFRNHIKEQIPFIYEEIIRKHYTESISNVVIDKIEKQFERYLTKLFGK